MIRFGAIMLGVTLSLLGSALAEAAKNVSAPVVADTGDQVFCIAANAGSGDISTIDVVAHVQLSDGTSGGGSSTNCGPVVPGAACKLQQAIGSAGSVFCEVIFSGKVRGSVCNLTKGLCLDTR